MKRTFWGDTKQRRRCISFFLCLLLCLNLLSLAGCGSGNGEADSPSEAENTASTILDSTDQTDTSWRDDDGSADATRPADSGDTATSQTADSGDTAASQTADSGDADAQQSGDDASGSGEAADPGPWPLPVSPLHQSLMETGFVFPDSDTRLLTTDDMFALSEDTVDWSDKLFRCAINEIYARHGYTFTKSKWFSRFYNRFDWYKPSSASTASIAVELNRTEQENLKLLTSWESHPTWAPPDDLPITDDWTQDTLNQYVQLCCDELVEGSDSVGNTYSCRYRIPEVLIDSGAVRDFNSSLKTNLLPEVIDARETLAAGFSLTLMDISYHAYLRNNILTVVTSVDYDFDWTDYYVLVVDVTTGTVLNNVQVGERFGLTEEELDKKIRDAVRGMFGNYEVSEYITRSEIDTMMNATLSEGNVSQAKVFPSSDGELYMICKIYVLAGAGEYYYLIKL